MARRQEKTPRKNGTGGGAVAGRNKASGGALRDENQNTTAALLHEEKYREPAAQTMLANPSAGRVATDLGRALLREWGATTERNHRKK
jgi:hypothetical protein